MASPETNPSDPADSQPADYPPISPVVPLHQQPDPNLALLTGFSHSLGFPLTLYMPWGIASGKTAAPNDYYRYLADRISGGIQTDDAVLRKAVDDLAEEKFGALSNRTVEELLQGRYQQGFDLKAFAVLQEVTCWIGGFTEPQRPDYLAVRLSDVTAWSWGAYA